MQCQDLLRKHNLQARIGSVGPGWVPTLDRLFTDLRAVGWDGRIRRLQEKYGGLDLVLEDPTEEMDRLVDIAEIVLDTTCEDCGAPAEMRTGTGRTWLRTLCEVCDARDSE